MAIENFVNFITNTITPPIIRSYGINKDDFTGNDSSTMEYTKLGWVIKCYIEMKGKGLVDGDVTSIVNEIVNLEDIPSLRSPSGYNLLQIILYDNKSNRSFSLKDDLDSIAFADLSSLALIADNNEGATAMHMAVDYGMHTVVNELGTSNTGHIDSAGKTGDIVSPWALAMIRGGEEVASGSEYTYRRQLALSLGNISGDYELFYGKNMTNTSAGGSITNEISKVIMTTSHAVLSSAVDWMVKSLPVSQGNLIEQAIEKSNGVSDTSYILGNYSSQQSESGYHPLYLYIHKYKSTVDLNILDKLSAHFSPNSIGISDTGDTEGFTSLALIAYYLTLSSDGEWDREDIATWIKSKISGADANSIWANTGNVRDFTGKASSNAFGVISNVLVKINDIHSSWWETQDKAVASVHDFEDMYTMSSGKILPAEIDYSFYRVWQVEFGKEVVN